ncbi:serine hydrolase domain-containing protein [Fluviicola sp.]|uniref:serine hydrolase domain-containing protein n=1 Tax=Fluviicola sp. TaxID=1917219 RepID=UPI002633BE69|nr:serine hydrolase domain-containing protein [Fluviicola sp.]
MSIQTALTSALLLAGTWSFGQENNTEKRLDSLFTTLAAQNQFNGSVLIAEKGKIIYKGGKGYSNELSKELNNTQTIFELASCSKQFTGVGIALLHREKKLDYTDDITKYFPELSNFKGVTIYDLLRHTSGIPDYLFAGSFSENWKSDRIASNQDLINYLAETKDTLEFTPGSKYAYTNSNYVLLASIMEKVSGQKWGDYLTRKIFKPLKMNRTFVYNRRYEPKKIKNYAYGYDWVDNSFEKVTQDDPKIGHMTVYYMDGIYGAAKVNSTVEDLYKWINALNNNQLLTQKEFEEVMETTKTSTNEDVLYGFGFEVRKRNNTISYGHTGSWDGYITLIHYSSKNDRTVIVLNNFKNGVCPYETISEIIDNKPCSNEFVKKADQKEEVIKQYVGEYADPENPDEKHVITYLDGHLIYNTDKANWDMRFFPSSEAVFQAIRQGGTNGVMEFTLQEDGTMKLEMSMYGRVIGKGVRN